MSDVRSAQLDGVAVDPSPIPLLGDSATHEVVVVLSGGRLATALELSSDDRTSSTDRDSSTD